MVVLARSSKLQYRLGQPQYSTPALRLQQDITYTYYFPVENTIRH
jgi:hypothetical protein